MPPLMLCSIVPNALHGICHTEATALALTPSCGAQPLGVDLVETCVLSFSVSTRICACAP